MDIEAPIIPGHSVAGIQLGSPIPRDTQRDSQRHKQNC
jgi:hypothetical protein